MMEELRILDCNASAGYHGCPRLKGYVKVFVAFQSAAEVDGQIGM
jgi:hypothetical protein